MSLTFNHIGVVARSVAIGRTVLQETLQIQEWTREYADPVNGVSAQFGRDASGICYEVVAPLGEDSPIAEAVKTRTRILNHVAYLVDDLDAEGNRLIEAGCVPATKPSAAIVFGGARIQFFLNRLAFIIELIEAPSHQHDYRWEPDRP